MNTDKVSVIVISYLTSPPPSSVMSCFFARNSFLNDILLELPNKFFDRFLSIPLKTMKKFDSYIINLNIPNFEQS